MKWKELLHDIKNAGNVKRQDKIQETLNGKRAEMQIAKKKNM